MRMHPSDLCSYISPRCDIRAVKENFVAHDGIWHTDLGVINSRSKNYSLRTLRSQR